MATVTKELVDEHIKNIPNLTTEEVSHYFKCASSSTNKLIKPYKLALEKEGKKRSKPIKTLSIDEEVAEQKAKEQAEEDKEKLQEY